MRSIASARLTTRARRASGSPAAKTLARAGLTARGVIYILIGWVAILVAIGHSKQQVDQQGALQLLAGQPFGRVLLWLLGIGFAGYALWRLSEAAFGVSGVGRKAGPRLRSLGRAVIYAALAAMAFQVISGSSGNQTRKQQDFTASIMRHPGGQVLTGLIGAVIAIAGVVLVIEGYRRTFMKDMRRGEMSPRTRRVVEWLGMAGSMARGVVVALVGVLVIDAAVSYHPSKAGGVDTALLTLRNQPFGEVLLILAALGLITFGIYGLCEARWRRV
ncbi:MAG TPA: DUF1206 domain-containing protein [Streptosporangiaceae bacterium]|nr:DUF1206 domain-containing protein [Streptosporangiaceae bacterium]